MRFLGSHGRVLLVASLLILFGSDAFAQSRSVIPKPGSFERKIILDTVRVPTEAKLKQPIVFQVLWLRQQKGWAFLRSHPVQANGKPVDYQRTPYAQAVREGFFSGDICTLLHKTQGRWRIVANVLGPTDVSYVDWDKRYGAPHAIFGLP